MYAPVFKIIHQLIHWITYFTFRHYCAILDLSDHCGSRGDEKKMSYVSGLKNNQMWRNKTGAKCFAGKYENYQMEKTIHCLLNEKDPFWKTIEMTKWLGIGRRFEDTGFKSPKRFGFMRESTFILRIYCQSYDKLLAFHISTMNPNQLMNTIVFLCQSKLICNKATGHL